MKKDRVIYRHLKSCGEVFYIGIGSKTRAHSKGSRNIHWNNIVNKYGYEVQILKTNLSWEEAVELEKILISWYGRRDLNKGLLVNLTEGGEGTVGIIPTFTKEHRQKLTNAQLGVKNHRYGKKGINLNKLRGNHPAAKKVIDIVTGKIWECVADCIDEINRPYDSIIKMLNGQRENKTNLRYLKNYENNKN